MPALSGIGYAEESPVTSAARTTSGSSQALNGYGGASTLRVQLSVTAATGVAPTLDVVVEDTLDGTNWNTIGTFSQKTAASREVINITTVFADQLRVRWTIGGTTPSFTFSLVVAAQAPNA